MTLRGVFLALAAILHTKATSLNPSASFLNTLVHETSGIKQHFSVKQVPGDGDCLFNAVAETLRHRHTGQHLQFDRVTAALADWLRQTSVDMLQRSDEVLSVEGGETMTSRTLLDMVADHYNMTGADYCTKMRMRGTWGGGPEIVALANYLRIPIRVYELCEVGRIWQCFQLKETAQFGGIFGDKPALCILCCDGRYPNIAVGKQKKVGDHFIALFPHKYRLGGPLFRLVLPWRGGSSNDGEGGEGLHDDENLRKALDFLTEMAQLKEFDRPSSERNT